MSQSVTGNVDFCGVALHLERVSDMLDGYVAAGLSPSMEEVISLADGLRDVAQVVGQIEIRAHARTPVHVGDSGKVLAFPKIGRFAK